MFAHTCRSEDDGPGGGERPVATQSVGEDHLGGGDRESREYSKQVTVTNCVRMRFCQDVFVSEVLSKKKHVRPYAVFFLSQGAIRLR